MPFIEHTDEHFKLLLAKARKIAESQQKLKDLITRRAENEQAAANAIAEKLQWRPLRAVAIIETQTCTNCGHQTQLFRSWGVESRRRADHAIRVEAAEVLDEGLPLPPVRYLIDTSTPVCMECLPERNV